MKKPTPARPAGQFYLMCVSALSLIAVSATHSDVAEARAKASSHRSKYTNAHRSAIRASSHVAHYRIRHKRSGGRVIQCVAYAKAASNVHLHGNARDWWRNAEGIYARGEAPEPGAVLNFRPIRRMPLGHVAVVRQIVDDRTIIIDQSHWGQRGVARNTKVIDVSPNNDWSAVRVALNGNPKNFGSIYPTFGFIYERPDSSIMLANSASTSHANARASLQQVAHRSSEGNVQVAEAPATAFSVDGPEHQIR